MNLVRFTFASILVIYLEYFFILNPSFSQSAVSKYDQISLEQGLSQSTVYSVVQDSKGFMWFGTQDGLNRFDGYNVKVFKHVHNDSNTISDNTIWSLLSDSNDDLWIGTLRGGLNKYSISENKFYRYLKDSNDSTSISDDFITCIFEDSQKRLWIGTYTGGLNLYNKNEDKFERFIFKDENISSINSNTVWSITEDLQKNIWIATSNGIAEISSDELSRYDNLKSDLKFNRYNHIPDDQNSLSGNNIQSLAIDDNGNLWIGTFGAGLNFFNTETQQFKRILQNSYLEKTISINSIRKLVFDKGGKLIIATFDAGLISFVPSDDNFILISDDVVMSLYVDITDILWVGTFTLGVKYYDKNKSRFKHYYDDPNNPNDLSGNYIFSILEDKTGFLWVGTHSYGLNRFNQERVLINKYFSETGGNSSINNNTIRSLIESKSQNENIWIGTFGGGLNKYDRNSNSFTHYDISNSRISTNDITTLFEDSKNRLWIGHNTGIIDIYFQEINRFRPFTLDLSIDDILNDRNETDQIFRGTSINKIIEDKTGKIWIGTILGGLVLFDPVTGYSKRFMQGSLGSLNNNGITSLYEDNNGRIWIGTFGGGLNVFNSNDSTFSSFMELDGLPNNVVYGVLPDRDGNLWISTNKGISKFNPRNSTFKNYDVRDGLQSNEFNHGSYYISSSGELFFGGTNGFNSFFPEDIEDNEYIPPVYFTTFKIFNEELPIPDPIPSDQTISFKYSQNFFSFEFVALNYTAPEKNKYAYKLDGFDIDWHFVPSTQRYASYTNLDPGTYTLRIKGSNNDGIWNETGASILIVIEPPFWLTWWYRILIGLLIISIAVITYQYRVKKIRKLDLMRLRIARDLHDEVGSDLGGISMISQRLQKAENIPDNIALELSEISKASLNTSEKLRDIVWFVNPEHDKSEQLILRLKDLTGNLLKEIEYSFIVGQNVSFNNFDIEFRRQIFLIFKEVLYNIARHSNASKVEIEINNNGQNLVIKISDDGIGMKNNFNKSSNSDEYFSEIDKMNIGGMGIKNIKKRAEILNASLEIKSEKEKGTIINLTIPIP